MSGKIRKRPEPAEYIVRSLEGVALTFLNDAGAQVKEEFTLEVKSYTNYGLLKLRDKIEGQGFVSDVHVECAVLAEKVLAIIDKDGEALTDESGEPARLTTAFFAGLLDEDREAINAAIKADANPQQDSPSGGDGGSSPEANKGS